LDFPISDCGFYPNPGGFEDFARTLYIKQRFRRENTMSMHTRQQGGSGIGLIIFLAIAAYGVFVAIQYVPQYIESAAVKSILDNISDQNNHERMGDMSAVQRAIDKQLYINERDNLKNSFTITPIPGHYVITVRYERELDLLYAKKKIPYEKTVTLK